jgi:predicted negative regulator of RcsB-dependent stress response
VQSLDRLPKGGGVLVAQGKLQEALEAYQQSLKIRQTLAEQDTTNFRRIGSLAFRSS